MVRDLTWCTAGAVLGAVAVVFLLDSHDSRISGNDLVAPAATASPSDAQFDFETTFARLVAQPASMESDAALAALGSITNPALRREVALVLVDAFGGDHESIDRVAAGLPSIEVFNFTLDALARLAARDSSAALEGAMAFDQPTERRLALLHLAPVLAAQDPVSAFAGAEMLDQPLALEFRTSLLDAWADIDPIAVLAFIESTDKNRIPEATRTFELIAAREPERLLALIEEFPRGMRRELRTITLPVLVGRDPAAAFSYIEAVPPPREGNDLRRNVAEAYGELDPEAAWRWAQAQQPRSAAILSAVLNGMHRADPDGTLDTVLSELTRPGSDARSAMRAQLRFYLSNMAESASSDDVIRTFDRVSALEGTGIARAVQSALEVWSRSDPEAAVQWSLRHIDSLAPRALNNVGRMLALSDSDAAQQIVYEIPEEFQGNWVRGVTRALVATDPGEARAWVLAFPRGELRDQALDQHLSYQAIGGSIDAQMFLAFSDETARERAASATASNLSCYGNMALAYEVYDTYIGDTDLREDTRGRIEHNEERSGTCE